MEIIRKILMTIIACLMTMGIARAQGSLSKLEGLVDQEEEVRLLDMSDNGNWIAWQSTYESRPPELKIASVHKAALHRTEAGAREWQFIRRDEILYRVGNTAKLVNLAKNKEIRFSEVKHAGYSKHLDLVYIHYTGALSDRVELYDQQWNNVQSFTRVIRVIDDGNELLVIKRSENGNEMIACHGQKAATIFTSSSEIYSASPSGLQAGGWLVREKADQGIKLFWISPDLSAVALAVGGRTKFDAIQQHPSSDSNAVLLTVETKKPEKEQMVDIWYGSDFDLEDHFRDEKMTRSLLWYPESNRLIETDHPDYRSIGAIGKSGLFLRAIVDHEQVDKNDKTAVETVEHYALYDPRNGQNIPFARTSGSFITDAAGKYILYMEDDEWMAYDTLNHTRQEGLFFQKDAAPYFISSDEVLWIVGNKLWRQNLLTLKKKLLATFAGDHLEILNASRDKSRMELRVVSQSVDLNHPLVISVNDENQNRSSMVTWHRGSVTIIVDETDDRISEFASDKALGSFAWIAENFNHSPDIVVRIKNKANRSLYKTSGSLSARPITKKQLHYKGVSGEDLYATVYFPPGFSKDTTYPVVVSIYEIQRNNANRYLKPTFKNSRGFNERLFLESGYMVMLPDIHNTGSQGPGMAALHNVNAALDALEKIGQADMEKVGLVGQSYGGYETNFIATRSDRFAAYISGASIADLINTSFAFNYNFFSADYYRYEDGQFKLGKFTDNKEKYYRNNPLYYADQVNSPMLLWAGTHDKNVSPEQTRSFYNALRKYRKPVIALFYKDEQHSLLGNKQRKDLSIKMLEWFDYFLYGKKEMEWIDTPMVKSYNASARSGTKTIEQ
jgi:dienelactone hydrolase